jgi:hypothetical protein
MFLDSLVIVKTSDLVVNKGWKTRNMHGSSGAILKSEYTIMIEFDESLHYNNLSIKKST